MEMYRINEIGIGRGTDLQDAIESNFKGETQEVGLYLAMARQAQREGYPEIGEIFRQIALEEAEHAARFAELSGMISESTKENIERMLRGELGANKSKRESAIKAKSMDIDEAHDCFDEAARDEARHALMLQGILNRFYK